MSGCKCKNERSNSSASTTVIVFPVPIKLELYEGKDITVGKKVTMKCEENYSNIIKAWKTLFKINEEKDLAELKKERARTHRRTSAQAARCEVIRDVKRGASPNSRNIEVEWAHTHLHIRPSVKQFVGPKRSPQRFLRQVVDHRFAYFRRRPARRQEEPQSLRAQSSASPAKV